MAEFIYKDWGDVIRELIKNQPYQSFRVKKGYPESEEAFLENFWIQVGETPHPSGEGFIPNYSNDPADFGFTYDDFISKEQELQDALPMTMLREERNALLQRTDWQATTDRTMTQEQKDYRQELRDLPSTQTPTIDEHGGLINVTWPTEPE